MALERALVRRDWDVPHGPVLGPGKGLRRRLLGVRGAWSVMRLWPRSAFSDADHWSHAIFAVEQKLVELGALAAESGAARER